MKIKVEPGVVVRLDRKRSTSARGGEYDISNMDEKARKRVLSQKGVSEVKAATASKATKEG
ncbi:MAG TPA: hypothetical protein VK966_04600 [Longimicrobiales bacterium]|nr:hypothetical protein [Longimicrobiales bacterium]